MFKMKMFKKRIRVRKLSDIICIKFGVLRILITILLFLASISTQSQTYSLTASIDHIGYGSEGKPTETNSEVIMGKTGNSRFLLYPDPVDHTIFGATYCGWDGEALRWYEIKLGAGGTSGAFLANRITTNSYIEANLQSVPVPRAADRGIQCLSLLFLSPSKIAGYNQDGTNEICLDGQLHVPEMFSQLEIITNPETGTLSKLTAHAANWIWVKKNNYKERRTLPSPLDKGYINWTLEVTKYDDATGLPAQFDFKKYFYNMASVKDSKRPKENLIGETIGAIHYAKDMIQQSEWVPIFPIGKDVIIHDYRNTVNLESMGNVMGLTAIMRRSMDARWTLYPLANGTNDEWRGVKIVGKDEPSVSRHRQMTFRAIFIVLVLLIPIPYVIFAVRNRKD